MPLRTYEEVRPWAKAILNSTVNREMPPFHATGPIGRYVDDPRLTNKKIDLIRRWVAAGSPPGPPVEDEIVDAPAESPAWSQGEPDLILKSQPYLVKTEGEDYAAHILDYVFPEDVWVGAIEIRQSDYSIVHHSTVYLLKIESDHDEARFARRINEGRPHISGLLTSLSVIGDFVGGWLPGRPALIPMAGGVTKIPAGARLVLNNHYYTPPGADRSDRPPTVQTEVGFYYFDGELTEQRGVAGASLKDGFEIPPGDPLYVKTAEVVLEHDVLIESYGLHMHLRGKSSTATLIYPDGRQEVIFHVPRFDLNWQRTYELVEPIFAPAGSRILHRTVWDNSDANPNNPDPSATVTIGLLSTDEMWVVGVGYVLTEPRDPPWRFENGKRL
jgi:hypothetical protein